jgi:plasmid stabilization system protein ParE
LEKVSGVAPATRYVADLRSHIEEIARLGHSGSPREEISPGLRIVVHGNYNIYFRVTRTRTVIARVLHSARDVALQLPRGAGRTHMSCRLTTRVAGRRPGCLTMHRAPPRG